MNARDAMVILGRMGMRYPPSSAALAEAYFHDMIKDGRVIAIYKDGGVYGLLAFSLCFDYIPYWRKETWDYRPHEVDGTTLYVELLAARHWNKEARETFAKEILTRYPQIEQAIWHKWATWGDRKVTWRRKWAMK
jgi:hypothetical protein